MRNRKPRRLGVLVGLGLGALLAAGPAAAEEGRIAYLAWTEGFWQVWTLAPDGGARRQVTRSPYEKTRISWLPDGRRLLVNGAEGKLFVVDVDTGEESPTALPVAGTLDAVVSPDGTRIAFSLSTAQSRDDNEIWVVNFDGSDLRRLTQMAWLQHEPAWDPAGQWIYFLSGDGRKDHDIWRVSPTGASREQLTAGSGYHFELAVARDGRLAYSNDRTGNYEIHVQEPGQPPKPVTDHPALDGHPTWAPDGNSLVFHSARSGRLNLWQVDLAGGAPRRLTDHDRGARNPVWWHPRSETP
jgi:TolB protein